ncbi:MAG: HAD-IC family P-type ATPase, partial [Candidatus Eremiobacterota bacterium]
MSDAHEVPLEEVYRRVQSGPQGLSLVEAARRLREVGPNTLHVRRPTPAWVRFLRLLLNLFSLLLFLGAGLAWLAHRATPGEGYDSIAAALVGVVLLNTLFAYLQERKSEKIMESFRRMLPDLIPVLRDGEERQVPASEVVPGDVIAVYEGERIPADARLIELNVLKVDNSALTGESEPQLRRLECTHPNLLESRNMVFSGTLALSGNGRAVVCATGMRTQIGRIVRLTRSVPTTRSPIGRELDHFTRIITLVAVGFGLFFFSVSLAMGKSVLPSLVFGIGILVANVPEGLLPTVTLSFSMAARRMAARKALVRKLEGVETLGATTVICTDKTGTITRNQMAVSTLILGGHERPSHSVGWSDSLEPAWRCMALCNNAHLEPGGPRGDPTEGALLAFANRLNPIHPLLESAPRLYESPFDSHTRRMITTHAADGRYVAYLKGAPEVVLAACDRMDPVDLEQAQSAYRRLASRGERVLALAWRHQNELRAEMEGFVFLGLVGLRDPPRPEIPDALRRCREAGIRVFMVTGDHSLTAESVARQVGLLTGLDGVVTGAELDRMTEVELAACVRSQELVFARTTPEQKLRIVQALKAQGEVVTVTGDGVNDAPALKHADMGVSMGLSGTEVAREASELVLLDDNFATIVAAVEEGRTIFANLRKFIAYIITSNVAEMMPCIAYLLLDLPLPLTITLILTIDLGTDMLPAIGLGAERPEGDVMQVPPRSRAERLLQPRLLALCYGFYGVWEAIAGFAAYFWVLAGAGWVWGEQLSGVDPTYRTAVTAFFAAVVVGQVANALVCRTRRQSLLTVGMFSNRTLLLGILVELALLAAIVYLPHAQAFFATAPLSPQVLLAAVPFAVVLVLLEELRKALVR